MSAVQKMWKNKVWKLDLSEKIKVLAPQEVNFFFSAWIQPRDAQVKVLQIDMGEIKKKASLWSTKKVKT